MVEIFIPGPPPRRRRARPLPGQRNPLSLSIASSVSRGRVAPLAEELVERAVDLVGMGPGDGVRASFDDDQLHVLDQAGQAFSGLVERQEAVGTALERPKRHVEITQVAAASAPPGWR